MSPSVRTPIGIAADLSLVERAVDTLRREIYGLDDPSAPMSVEVGQNLEKRVGDVEALLNDVKLSVSAAKRAALRTRFAEDVTRLREILTDEENAALTDAVLGEAIRGAIAWINGERFSWGIVARNYLRHGQYRP